MVTYMPPLQLPFKGLMRIACYNEDCDLYTVQFLWQSLVIKYLLINFNKKHLFVFPEALHIFQLIMKASHSAGLVEDPSIFLIIYICCF